MEPRGSGYLDSSTMNPFHIRVLTVIKSLTCYVCQDALCAAHSSRFLKQQQQQLFGACSRHPQIDEDLFYRTLPTIAEPLKLGFCSNWNFKWNSLQHLIAPSNFKSSMPSCSTWTWRNMGGPSQIKKHRQGLLLGGGQDIERALLYWSHLFFKFAVTSIIELL